jgi:hypothetical protein
MSDRKELGIISYHADDETGMNYVGEIDGGFDETKLEKYIKNFGIKGVSDLMGKLGYMAYQVQKQLIVQHQLSGSADKSASPKSDKSDNKEYR